MKHTTFDLQAAQSPDMRSTASTAFLPSLDLTLVDADQATAVASLLAPGRRRAFFMNAHCCNIMAKDRQYADAIRRADMLLPDGVGIAIAGRMTGDTLTANLNGTDLTPALLAKAADLGKSVYLFGGRPGTAEAAAAKLQSMIHHLKIVGTRDGFEGARDTDSVIADINRSGADIVIVALGVPLQELWIDRYSQQLDAQICLGVGAALDFLAGNVMRAPRLVRRAKMEWVWRLAMEPRRMFKRYLLGNFSFLSRAAWRVARQTDAQHVANRAMDLAIASAALVALAPVLLTTAVAIKLDSRGSVLFRQTRVGKDGQTFPMLKFRSMHVDAEARLSAVLDNSDREGVCFKARNDPRITRVGRFIRRSSIDELPQIINVLRGEMSIVGPRPALPREVAQYPARALGRLAAKPGITGIWQVSGRADVSFDNMVEMDLIYARSKTILLDLILILLTFRAVVSGRGAY